MTWTHAFNYEHDEECPECGKPLELRYIGQKEWVFYCPGCLRHNITESKEIPNGEDRK